MDGYTCQVCGRGIKTTSRSGVIAYHGYKVPQYGSRTKDCAGAGYPPYEVSVLRLQAVIQDRREYVEQLKENYAKLMVSPPQEIKVSTKNKPDVVYKKPEDFNVYGKRGISRYEYEFNKIKCAYADKIRMGEADIQYMTYRLTTWDKLGKQQKMDIVGFLTEYSCRCTSCIVGLRNDDKMLEAVKTGVMPHIYDSNNNLIHSVLEKHGPYHECDKCHCKLAQDDNFNEELQQYMPNDDSWNGIEIIADRNEAF